MNSAGDVAVGGVVRLQSRTAGEFNPLETELVEFPFLCPADDSAVAFYTGAAKFLHFFFSFFIDISWSRTKKHAPFGLERVFYALAFPNYITRNRIICQQKMLTLYNQTSRIYAAYPAKRREKCFDNKRLFK